MPQRSVSFFGISTTRRRFRGTSGRNGQKSPDAGRPGTSGHSGAESARRSFKAHRRPYSCLRGSTLVPRTMVRRIRLHLDMHKRASRHAEVGFPRKSESKAKAITLRICFIKALSIPSCSHLESTLTGFHPNIPIPSDDTLRLDIDNAETTLVHFRMNILTGLRF
ncbi:unnamed protein product [Hapterophycus canaliculatus]